jgi:hypothetical protein
MEKVSILYFLELQIAIVCLAVTIYNYIFVFIQRDIFLRSDYLTGSRLFRICSYYIAGSRIIKLFAYAKLSASSAGC